MLKFIGVHEWLRATIALILFVGNVYCFVLFMEVLRELGDTGVTLLLLMFAMYFCFTVGTDTYSSVSSRVRSRRIQAELDTERAIRRLQGEDY